MPPLWRPAVPLAEQLVRGRLAAAAVFPRGGAPHWVEPRLFLRMHALTAVGITAGLRQLFPRRSSETGGVVRSARAASGPVRSPAPFAEKTGPWRPS
jgi:hypothetical protein